MVRGDAGIGPRRHIGLKQAARGPHERPKVIVRQAIDRSERVDAADEADLGLVHVPDARQGALIEQGVADPERTPRLQAFHGGVLVERLGQ